MLVDAPDGLPTNTPTGVGASGALKLSSGIKNAICKVAKQEPAAFTTNLVWHNYHAPKLFHSI